MSNPPASPSSSSSTETTEGVSTTSNRSWWRWRWRSAPVSVIGEDTMGEGTVTPPPPAVTVQSGKTEMRREERAPVEETDLSAWERIRELYTKPSMERDVLVRTGRMTFFAGFVMGGASGYQLARQQYETANKGRKYLSPSDALKRRYDYAIVRFAMGGFKMGIKAALLSGSIVLLSTHTAAIRRHFSALYFPAFSGPLALLLHSVGGVFTFPLGLLGSAKAVGLGITSGLTLSAVCGLYALSTDRTVDSAYWHLKKEWEAQLREEGAYERRIQEVMDERKVWRYEAVKIVKEEEEAKLHSLDA